LPLDIDEAIRAIVDLQLRTRMDIISDGEQRADMITYFEEIPGLRRGTKGLVVDSKILPPPEPLDLAKTKDFILAKDYLRTLGREDIALKTAITGPITLGVTCAAAGLKYYSGLRDHRLYRDLSEALEPLISTLLKLGSYVQIDEPGLSARYMVPAVAVPILKDLFNRVNTSKKISGSLSIHVCGRLDKSLKIVESLLGLNLDVVSLAFSGPTERSNIDQLSESLLEGSGKHLGVGCTSVSITQKETVEGAEDIYKRIKEVCDKVGRKNVAYAHPDCGLKGTPLEVSEFILQRLSEGVDQYNRDI
jgi:methionine synthase II (cobalamin-independent)